MQSEQEILLEHLAKDDDMAYTLLYKQFYVPMVLFASQYINNEEASKDVVQEFFISMLGQKKDFENVTALKVYLYHSVKNRCMNYINVMMLSLDGYKISEVAEKMGISLETAKEYKKEGKKRLSVRLRSLGLELFISIFF